ncbi:MAG: 4-hydroxythreonine-4-phosphate dehydrogenase PdxA [Limnobacter sp.]|nr:4-hydroxythreonine-4-phosphate dehydrogenase PdxA [Limnobacter sp.]
MKPVLLTTGEPAGVGPELSIALAQADGPMPSPPVPVVLLGSYSLLESRAQACGLAFDINCIEHPDEATQPRYYVIDHRLNEPCEAGKPSSGNGQYVLDLIDLATDWCLSKKASAMVTAPIQKSAISPVYAGFQGHTEYLAQRCAVEQVVMMLQGGGLRVALATTHLPLHRVPGALSQTSLLNTLTILLNDLQTRFGLPKPRVLVTGLNPHAGESGTMGTEEVSIIQPVIEQLRNEGHAVSGPFPADTLFQPRLLAGADAVLAMYHDQGLPVLKFASFGQGVNITLGLPIVRTSVDHGTALDLAGTGKADAGSLHQALQLAIELGEKA